MSIIQIVEQDHTLVVDSRLIAANLGVDHKNFRELIESYKVKLEAKFGVYRFETAKLLTAKVSGVKSAGRPEKFYWLRELQATAVLTLVSNTDRAVDLKFDLVEKFDTAKKLLKAVEKKQRSQYDLNGMELQRLALALEVDNDQDRELILAPIEREFWGMKAEGIARLMNLLSLSYFSETCDIRARIQAEDIAEQAKREYKGFGGPSKKDIYFAVFADKRKEFLQDIEFMQNVVDNSEGIKACEEFEQVIAIRRLEAAKQALLTD
jgi:phage regulator Rha-like protein